MNHVSVSPTDGNGPTQGQRKTLTRVGIEPTTFGLDLRSSTDYALPAMRYPEIGMHNTVEYQNGAAMLYVLATRYAVRRYTPRS